MVKAILEGRKTQTRRVVKPQPIFEGIECYGDSWAWTKGKDNFSGVTTDQLIGPAGLLHETRCPFQKANTLWVKETFLLRHQGQTVDYRADLDPCEAAGRGGLYGGWKPSIFMPRKFSRITLEITAMRVERLQEISEADAMAEGVDWKDYAGLASKTAKKLYAQLWDSINGKKHPWKSNPWVWVVTFKKI